MNHEIVSEFASKTSYATSGTLMIFGFSLSDCALILGMILGVATFAVNWYYKAKMHREDN
jgi:uncharacterized membrane protein YphA (DoxX/SURF4 family)